MNAKFNMPKFRRELTGKGWLKELLMTFLGTTISIVLTFGTTAYLEDWQIMDIDTDGSKTISDSDVKAFFQMSHGIANPLMVQSLEKTRRNEVLRYALCFGAGIRQLPG